MQLCLLADTHRHHRQIEIPPCDLLIHCGDFCSFQTADEQTLEDVDAWFAELPARKIVCIGGNHDFLLHRGEFQFAHAEYLVDRAITFEGITIYGSPWCPDLTGFAFYQPEADLIEKWRAIPAGIDVLVTHTPPNQILDLPSNGTPHLGCPHLRQELQRIQPRLHVFGHIHASHGHRREEGIEFFNVAIAGGRDFHVCHGATSYSLAPRQS